jgi:hypothetical protein
VGTLDSQDGRISFPPIHAEVQATHDEREQLASDLRNLSTLIHSLRATEENKSFP